MIDKLEKGPLIAAAITAAVSLFTYGAGMLVHIDERLDVIEKQMQTVLDGDGNVRPSKEAIRAYYQLQGHETRIKELEAAHPQSHSE